MKLRQIRQFVVLAEMLNFHRAARALNMSQPPLSISIRKLEREMGVTLFDRQTRGVQLTEAGLAALPHARRILGAVESMGEAASAAVNGMGGRLSVGFVGSAVYTLLPRAVPLFRSQRPSVELRLREATTLEIIRGLETGELDLGVLRTPVFDAGDIALQPLCQEEMIVLLPRHHPLSGQPALRLEDLGNETYIGYDRERLPNFRNLSLSACGTAGFQPNIVEEAAHLHTLIALVESGIGIALAPGVARIPGADRICYARLSVQGRPLTIGLALATRHGDSRPARDAFVAALRDVAGDAADAMVGPSLATDDIKANPCI